MGCPAPGLPALLWHFPVGARALWQGGCPCACSSGWLGRGAHPLLICMCVVGRGGGPAPNYIKNISMLWLSLLRCLDSVYPLPLGKSLAEGVKSRLGCFKELLSPQLREGWQKPVTPPAHHTLLPGMEQKRSCPT